jgi:hypothetical protein
MGLKKLYHRICHYCNRMYFISERLTIRIGSYYQGDLLSFFDEDRYIMTKRPSEQQHQGQLDQSCRQTYTKLTSRTTLSTANASNISPRMQP